MNFIQNLNKKLNYATEASLINLGAVEATEVTTANTVVTLVDYASPKLDSVDIIEAQYVFAINNASGANEAITCVLYVGSNDITTTTATVNDGVDSDGFASIKAIKTTNGYLTTFTLSHHGQTATGTTMLSASDFTELSLTAKNDSTAAAGLDIVGTGGYVILDNVNVK